MKRWLVLVLALCLLLSGCRYVSEKTPGEGATIYYHLPEVVTSIDPQTVNTASARMLVCALYEGLCRVSGNNELLPGVAERWEHNSTYTEYTFYLRKDAVWNNGHPVTADDFVFAFTRALDPATGSADAHDLFCIKNARAIYYDGAAASTLGAVAVNSTTLKITLEEPDEGFPYKTAQAVYMPCNRTFFGESKGRYGVAYRTSCTNGLFSFVNRYSWEERKSISLCASSSYKGEVKVRPAYLELTMGSSSAPADALTALLAGDIDLCELTAADLEEARLAGCTVEEIRNTTYGIMLNPSDDVLKVEPLRQKLFAAIDPEKLTALTGDTAATQIVPEDVVWGQGSYREQVGSCRLPVYTPGVVDVSGILAENSLSSLGTMTILCGDDDFSKALANELVIAWNDTFGVYFNILPVDADTLQNRVKAGDYQICIYGVTAESYDPYAFLLRILSCCPGSGLDEELAAAVTGEDLFAVEQALLDKGVFYPVRSGSSYIALAPGVSGICLNRLTALDFTGALKTRK